MGLFKTAGALSSGNGLGTSFFRDKSGQDAITKFIFVINSFWTTLNNFQKVALYKINIAVAFYIPREVMSMWACLCLGNGLYNKLCGWKKLITLMSKETLT